MKINDFIMPVPGDELQLNAKKDNSLFIVMVTVRLSPVGHDNLYNLLDTSSGKLMYSRDFDTIGEMMSDVVYSYKVRWGTTASGFHDFTDVAKELGVKFEKPKTRGPKATGSVTEVKDGD